MDRLQIKKTTTPAYNPNSNVIERFHRTLNQILRLYMDRNDPKWERVIKMAVLAYNTKASSATGITPYEAWMGRRARLPIDLVLPVPGYQYENEHEYITDTLRRFHLIYRYVRAKSEASIHRNASPYSGATTHYQVGDLVWVYTKD